MITTAGQELHDRLGPLVDEDPDNVAVALCDTAGAMLGRLDEIVTDSPLGPGWSMILDPDRAPAAWLPWTAALYGVQLVAGSSEAEQRALIREQPAHLEGRNATIRAAVAATLTGTQLVRIVERPTGAYSEDVITRTSETPDPAATATAARSQKPAGIFPFNVLTSDEPLIDEFTRTIDDITAVIDDLTLADVT